MMKDRPLLSIVIANYNYGRFLPDAIESVIRQGASDVELIVCDAASTDNSVEVIKRYASHITWWCSEKDGGQSDAFNKGFSHASGRFLTWLNADDVMLPGTIDRFRKAVAAYPDQEWFVGGVLWLTKDMKVIRCGRGRRMSKTLAAHGEVNVCGPSSFFSKALYERTGPIDVRHRYTMDTDLWLRFALCQHQSFIPFTRYAWGLRLHEDAKMSGQNFDANGKLRENAFSGELLKKDEKRIRQLDEEWRITCEKLPPLRPKLSKLQTRLLAFPLPALLSRLDTMRFRGKPYLELFGGAK